MTHVTLITIVISLLLCPAALADDFVFPADAVVNVKTKYGAVGDGKVDDTDALRRALEENRMRTIYFPNGTYLISDSIGILNGKPHSRDRFLQLQGQSRAGTIIKLKDNAPGFDNPVKPKVLVSTYQGKSTGDAMHTNVRQLTIDVGKGNPGAAGFRYFTNNTGTMRNVTIRSSDPRKRGAIGLDLRQSQNGPGLIQHITVEGFDRSVVTGNTFSLVLEHINLINPRKVAFDNPTGRLTIRKLHTRNAPLAFRNGKHGHLTLIDADFTTDQPVDGPAIQFQSKKVFLRDVTQVGYASLAQDTKDKTYQLNAHGEMFPLTGYRLLGKGDAHTLRLSVEEPPAIPWETDLTKWIGIGKGKKGKQDVSDELQDAIDKAAETGATTIYFRKGDYQISKPIRVHGNIRRIIGMACSLSFKLTPALALDGGAAVFTLENLTSDAIVFERFFLFGGWDRPAVCTFENKSHAVVVLSNLGHGTHRMKRNTPGTRWFIEDLTGGRPNTLTVGREEKVWARHYNPESPRADMIHVTDGGQLWILGLKTEGRATHVIAENGAKVEVLGGVSYQSWKNQKLDPPMFKVINAEASFTLGFYHWDRWHFNTIVEEIQQGQTRKLFRKELKNYHLPVYRAGGE